MKRVALLLAVGVSGFLAGAITTSLWFGSRPAAEISPEAAPGEFMAAESAPAVAGNGSARATKFAALDTDQDGRLSLAEFGLGRPAAEAAKWFGRRDSDGDGFLSRREFLPVSAGGETR